MERSVPRPLRLNRSPSLAASGLNKRLTVLGFRRRCRASLPVLSSGWVKLYGTATRVCPSRLPGRHCPARSPRCCTTGAAERTARVMRVFYHSFLNHFMLQEMGSLCQTCPNSFSNEPSSCEGVHAHLLVQSVFIRLVSTDAAHASSFLFSSGASSQHPPVSLITH